VRMRVEARVQGQVAAGRMRLGGGGSVERPRGPVAGRGSARRPGERACTSQGHLVPGSIVK
jgi:hypothetical protein